MSATFLSISNCLPLRFVEPRGTPVTLCLGRLRGQRCGNQGLVFCLCIRLLIDKTSKPKTLRTGRADAVSEGAPNLCHSASLASVFEFGGNDATSDIFKHFQEVCELVPRCTLCCFASTQVTGGGGGGGGMRPHIWQLGNPNEAKAFWPRAPHVLFVYLGRRKGEVRKKRMSAGESPESASKSQKLSLRFS